MWESFLDLSQSREEGFSGPQPIKFSEMRAMADELGISEYDSRIRFFRRIRLLDNVLINYHREKDDSGKKKK